MLPYVWPVNISIMTEQHRYICYHIYAFRWSGLWPGSTGTYAASHICAHVLLISRQSSIDTYMPAYMWLSIIGFVVEQHQHIYASHICGGPSSILLPISNGAYPYAYMCTVIIGCGRTARSKFIPAYMRTVIAIAHVYMRIYAMEDLVIMAEHHEKYIPAYMRHGNTDIVEDCPRHIRAGIYATDYCDQAALLHIW